MHEFVLVVVAGLVTGGGRTLLQVPGGYLHGGLLTRSYNADIFIMIYLLYFQNEVQVIIGHQNA